MRDASAIQEKYYRIYRENYIKFGKQWAKELGDYARKRSNPFSRVTREVNSAMRRYLGGEAFMKTIDTLEYLILKEGLLVKDQNNQLDITEATFNDWAGTGQAAVT